MKNKVTLLLVFIFITSLVHAKDGYLSNLSIPNKYVKTNTNYTLGVNIRNSDNIPITACQVSWRLDNGSIHSEVFNIGGGGVVSGNYLPVTLSPDMNISSPGEHLLQVWIDVYGDTDHSNDTINKYLIALSNYANNKVLMEDYTATWCPSCPGANTVFKSLSNNPDVVLASFHDSDPYSFSEGESYMEAYYPGAIFTPGGVINMGEMGTYAINSAHNLWTDAVNARIGISPVALDLVTDLNTTTRELTITLKANFKYAYSGDFYLNVYITENDIQGSQTGGSSPYYHHHVVRAMLGGVSGISGIIPASPVENTDYTYQDNYTIPSAWNIDELEIIAIVFEKDQGNTEALNAAYVDYSSIGIDESSVLKNVNIYPNPTKDYFVISGERHAEDCCYIKIYNLLGETILSQTLSNINNQKIDISWFKKGIYFVHIENNKHKSIQFKLIKE